MPPARRLHLILRVQGIRRRAIGLEFVSFGRINIFDITMVVSNVSYLVLLELLGLRPINITQVHVVAALYLLLFPVGVHYRALYIFHIQFVVIVHCFLY